MKKLLLLLTGWWLTATLAAAARPEFPAHWGPPPALQTRDHVELPGDYGHGSSTLRKWIEANQAKDALASSTNAASSVLYANDFTSTAVGELPDDFLVLGGEFKVAADGTNHVLALPGAPLDSFGLQFGPAPEGDVRVAARVFGTSKGRRAPTFGLGLGGVSGWKVQVAPGKKALELLRDEEVKASVPFAWQSGTWTELRLELCAGQSNTWRVTAKAWPASETEPTQPLLQAETHEAPPAGRPSIIGSPFAGTPIWYDDLKLLALPHATATGK